MTINEFWGFMQAADGEYSDYRRRIMSEFDLTAAETDVLMFLANNPAFDTAAQISRTRRIPKSQVSASVNALYDKGLLTGNYLPNNRKSVHLALTEKAEPVVNFGRKMQESFAAELFSGFTDEEKAEFFRLQRKMAENIETKRKKKP